MKTDTDSLLVCLSPPGTLQMEHGLGREQQRGGNQREASAREGAGHITTSAPFLHLRSGHSSYCYLTARRASATQNPITGQNDTPVMTSTTPTGSISKFGEQAKMWSGCILLATAMIRRAMTAPAGDLALGRGFPNTQSHLCSRETLPSEPQRVL